MSIGDEAGAKDRAALRASVAADFEAALGPTWRSRLARALGVPTQRVVRWFSPPKGRDDAPPRTLVVLAELLRATPERHRPARWTSGGRSG